MFPKATVARVWAKGIAVMVKHVMAPDLDFVILTIVQVKKVRVALDLGGAAVVRVIVGIKVAPWNLESVNDVPQIK